MGDLDVQLKKVQEKLQQLLRQYQVLQKENQQLKAELGKAHAARQENEGRLQQLQEQLMAQLAGNNSRTAEERKLLEKRIDTYLKEIEKCLSLLNA